MSKSNLVPERRTDKNGVTSTRWVKQEFINKDVSTIPVPAAPSQANSSPMLTSLFEQYSSDSGFVISDLDQEAVAIVEGILTKLDDPEYIAREGINQLATRMKFESLIINSFRRIGGNGDKDYSPFNNVVALGASVTFRRALVSGPLHMYLNGIKPLFPGIHDFHKQASAKQLSQAQALCHLITCLTKDYLDESREYNEYDDDDRIEDHVDDDPELYYSRVSAKHSDLVELVMRRPESVKIILGIIKERGSADAAMLEQVLNHEESALREGAL